MSLRSRERRILNGIQGALGTSDPQLASLFATFSRLMCDEEMPHLEQLRVRIDRLAARGRRARKAVARRLRVIVIAPVALTAAAVALMLGGWSSSPGACKAGIATVHAASRAPARPPARARLGSCQSTWLRPAVAGH